MSESKMMGESKLIIKSNTGVEFAITSSEAETAINIAQFAKLLDISAGSVRVEMHRSQCSPLQACANVLARKGE
ncbi:hypothetical protein SR70_06630 [Klebsiella aerogenes]|uniref:hypothetical protein n=1 Tax=Klebsiella aerogenes TaxID=548 RepID=UPI0005EE91AB|nr:hypothetical protein [Klebsiella aerogenes]KJP43143.1 hypothetical protein SR70_06630 [Klebsiella aerogenes]